jgi:hypothetical protein
MGLVVKQCQMRGYDSRSWLGKRKGEKSKGKNEDLPPAIADILRTAGDEYAGLVLVSTKRFLQRDARAITRALQVLTIQETALQMRNSARFLLHAGYLCAV